MEDLMRSYANADRALKKIIRDIYLQGLNDGAERAKEGGIVCFTKLDGHKLNEKPFMARLERIIYQ